MPKKIIISEEQKTKILRESWFPTSYSELPTTFRIYHGTRSMESLNNIVETMALDAKEGGQHGETYGVNWFALEDVGYGVGGVISIAVNKEEFETFKFKFMNNSDVVSEDSRLDLTPYDMKIESIMGIPAQRFVDAFNKADGDVWKFQDIIFGWNKDGNNYIQLSSPAVRYVIEQEFGKGAMKEYYDFINSEDDSVLNESEIKKVRQGIIPYEADTFHLGSDQPGGGDLGNYHVIAEDIDDMINDLAKKADYSYMLTKKDVMDRIDLSSFRPQKRLDPNIWPNGMLNSKIRLRLLDIADDFIDFLNVGWAKHSDIILTGSLCSFNYSRYSDFDLHILYDFTQVDERVEFVKQYFDSKKAQWNQLHEELKIYGYPVEVYVQDVHEEHTANGMYSIESNKWLKKPVLDNVKAIKLEKFLIKEKILKFARAINKLIDEAQNTTDNYELEQIGVKVKKLFDKIKGMRREALKARGEMSVGNIVFKYLRRYDYISDLMDLKYELYDKIKSMKKVDSQ